MAKSKIAEKLNALAIRRGIETVAECFGTGMDTPCRAMPVNVLAWTRNENLSGIAPLVHQRYVLLVCCRGSWPLRVDGLDFRIGPGEAMLWLPFQVHSYGRTGPEDEVLVITFTVSSGGETLTPLGNRVLKLEARDETALAGVIAALQRTKRISPATAIAGLAGVLGRLLERETESENFHFGEDKRLAGILDYLNLHAEEALSVKTVADHFKMTPETLRKLFHERFGTMTPKDYLRRIRLRRAGELLLRTGKSINEIAHECGFRDPFTFSRAFKREHRMSPRAWRVRIAEKQAAERSIPKPTVGRGFQRARSPLVECEVKPH